MKKINLTTVKMTADCEVIGLSAAFVAAAVRAADVAETLKDTIAMQVPKSARTDEEGDTIVDKNGKPIEEPDWNMAHICICGPEAKEVYDKLIPFLIELRNAMLGEEERV